MVTLGAASTLAQNPQGKGSVSVGSQAQLPAPWYSGSYALLIGVSDYTHGWTDLPSVGSELDEVEEILVRHGFEVRRVRDPDAEGLKDALDGFVADHGYTSPDDRLFIFFSGHGHTETIGSKHQRGYLVPADAPDPRKNLRGFKRKALSMEDVETAARKLEAKHALFVFDSCFSGTIFQTKALPRLPPAISERTSKPVRQFIAAGSADEEVPSESLFTPLLVQALKGDGDLSGDGFVTGAELGMFLTDQLVNAESGQTPQYGKISIPRLREGDFVFEAAPPEFSPAEVSTSPRPPASRLTSAGNGKGRDQVRGVVSAAEIRVIFRDERERTFATIGYVQGRNQSPRQEIVIYTELREPSGDLSSASMQPYPLANIRAIRLGKQRRDAKSDYFELSMELLSGETAHGYLYGERGFELAGEGLVPETWKLRQIKEIVFSR